VALPDDVFVGFFDTLDISNFGFIARNTAPGGPLTTWKARVFDGATLTEVDTGVIVPTDCANASDLEIDADAVSIRFFIGGVLMVTIPTPAGIIGDNFTLNLEADQPETGSEVTLEVDYACASMGRKCQDKPAQP